MKEDEKEQEKKTRMSSIRKSQASAKLYFVSKFSPVTQDKPETDMGTNPHIQSKPKPKARMSPPEIVLSTPKKKQHQFMNLR